MNRDVHRARPAEKADSANALDQVALCQLQLGELIPSLFSCYRAFMPSCSPEFLEQHGRPGRRKSWRRRHSMTFARATDSHFGDFRNKVVVKLTNMPSAVASLTECLRSESNVF